MAWTSEIVAEESGSDWASVGTGSGEGNEAMQKIRVTVKKNDSKSERSAKVLIVSGTASAEVAFSQPPLPEEPEKILRLTEGSAEVGAEGGRVEVTVQFNVPYECEVAADWIHEVKAKSYEESVHVFEIDVNTVAEPRSATIQFCGNSTCIPFTVTQAAAAFDYQLAVDTEKLYVSADGTVEPMTVNVSSNLSWSVASDADWCSVSPEAGENDGEFNISVEPNESYESRIAYVTLSSADGAMSTKVSVVQSPVYQDGGDDSWKTAEFSHRSLAFRFTADWCGYCPMMATAMANAQKELDGRLEVISVHGGGSGLECSASVNLLSQYFVQGFPTGLVDGITYIQNMSVSQTTSKIVDAVRTTEDKYDPYTSTSWKSALDEDKLAMDLSVYVQKAGTYKVTALVVEDKVIGYQADYNSGTSMTYEHNGIIRTSLSDVAGEQFTIDEDGMVKHYTFAASLPSGCNPDNVRIVVYVQKQIENQKKFYVDNTASAPVGEDKALN
jgi:thiol-disulfide isomerase/thioredoxin